MANDRAWSTDEQRWVYPDFDDCPNVRGVLMKLAGADPVWEPTDAQAIQVEAAMERIGQILGLPGWMGTKMFGQHTIGAGIGEQ